MHIHQASLAALLSAAALTACGGDDGGDGSTLPQLSPATAATLKNCTSLTTFSHTGTAITAATVVPAGTLTNAGTAVGEHCLITGKMNERVSSVDGQTYAISFQMRLPTDWSGRFLYQGNGGTDGSVVTADGGTSIGSGGLLRNGLQQGFAVISSDAGHTSAQNPLFGLDPQARLDYGYQAVAKLTPMAKALIAAAYGKGPDRSYIAGTSNGGRHAMVAAARLGEQYDGVLANAPGFNLPKAAIAQLFGAQQWATVATSTGTTALPDLESALPIAERKLLAAAIVSRCDALDGVADEMVQDIEACRTTFSLARDVPTCSGARDNTCLSAAQKTAIAKVFAGATNSSGVALYAGWPYDPGLAATGWADWKFRNAVRNTRDPVAMAFIFSTPPEPTSVLSDTLAYALAYNFDTDVAKVSATNSVYTESAMSFMTPPKPTELEALRNRGGKMIVVHGVSDPVFSVDDTRRWYEAVDANYNAHANRFVRFFRVPGMGHSRGGPSTDQYDALSALVAWVEQGQAPDRIVATARGTGNLGGVNAEVPSSWSATRSRPLCPYPQVARYVSGDSELAASFACAR